jgi:hypothetical protein
MTLSTILNRVAANASTVYKFCVDVEGIGGLTIQVVGGERITFPDELYYSLDSTVLASKVYEYVVRRHITDFLLIPAIAEYCSKPWYRRLFTFPAP